MKQKLIKWFVKTAIKHYFKFKDEDFINYLFDVLQKDEIRMVSSREALQGYYDLDLQINRQLQNEIKEYVRD